MLRMLAQRYEGARVGTAAEQTPPDVDQLDAYTTLRRRTCLYSLLRIRRWVDKDIRHHAAGQGGRTIPYHLLLQGAGELLAGRFPRGLVAGSA
jgi:hypothetical protein